LYCFFFTCCVLTHIYYSHLFYCYLSTFNLIPNALVHSAPYLAFLLLTIIARSYCDYPFYCRCPYRWCIPFARYTLHHTRTLRTLFRRVADFTGYVTTLVNVMPSAVGGVALLPLYIYTIFASICPALPLRFTAPHTGWRIHHTLFTRCAYVAWHVC